jgi:hypothetical protein
MSIAKAIRKEFIRRMKLNERYEFDYIQLLWAVDEANVEIYYDKQIGKGTQSLVFSGWFIYLDSKFCKYRYNNVYFA